jgi:2-polyprenyl-3-methyl-5-hydroxy-6-metoxy-1,4-benzoquinol methylase
MTSGEIILPDRENIYKTSDGDPSDYYYKPIIGAVYRQRLKAAAQLLGEQKFDKLLEIGFGSGIFLSELSRHCTELYGVSIHSKVALVQKAMEEEHVAAQLMVGDVRALGFPDGTFDAVVCVSVLEHLRELDLAIGEIARVTSDSGIVVLGFPVRNVITSTFYRIVGHDPMELHPSRCRDILKALSGRLKIDAYGVFPPFLPMYSSLYVTCRCIK